MRYIFVLLVMTATLFSAHTTQERWKKGEVFSAYLQRNGISLSLLKTISSEDLQYLAEIQAGEQFRELREDGKLLQALIPVGEEMQIHLFKDMDGEKFHFDIIPIVCRHLSDSVTFVVEKGLSEDINRWTRNPRLGYLLKKYYGKSVNFRTLKKGDRVSFLYTQRSRLGKPYGSANIKASLIQTRGKNKFIFADEGGIFYDDTHKDIAYIVKKRIKTEHGKPFARPLRKMRITSKFTYKRWHPILKRYRPHLGVDFGGRKGTPIYATHAGKVIYSGWMSGYGKVIKIAHSGGFVSLYAHQSRLAAKKGKYVKRGEMIGFVGNTGRSTGPHLHFGLYKNSKAVDPMQYVQKKALSQKRIEVKKITKHKIVEIVGAKENKIFLLKSIGRDATAFRWITYTNLYDRINDRSQHEKQDNKF